MPMSRSRKLQIIGLVVILALGLAGWGVSCFINFVRHMHPPNYHIQLSRCCEAVAEHVLSKRSDTGSGPRTLRLPPGMTAPVCPGKGRLTDLGSEPQPFDAKDFEPGGPAQVLAKSGIAGQDAWLCLQYTPGQNAEEDVELAVDDGTFFTCHGWTDLDEDGKAAHWTKRGTYSDETESFTSGHVWHDDETDDW